jgi:hypothetical protein
MRSPQVRRVDCSYLVSECTAVYSAWDRALVRRVVVYWSESRKNNQSRYVEVVSSNVEPYWNDQNQ